MKTDVQTERHLLRNLCIDSNFFFLSSIDDDVDTKTWVGNNRDYNGLDWEPFGDTLDYPNNQAKPKVKLINVFNTITKSFHNTQCCHHNKVTRI